MSSVLWRVALDLKREALMTKLYTSGKDTDPKVPYQNPDPRRTVIPAKRSTREMEAARKFFAENPFRLRYLED